MVCHLDCRTFCELCVGFTFQKVLTVELPSLAPRSISISKGGDSIHQWRETVNVVSSWPGTRSNTLTSVAYPKVAPQQLVEMATYLL